MEEDDQRFAHIKTDPKFRRIPKAERKVKIDKRFKSMFKEKQFKLKYTIDKRGRPVSHTTNEDLKRYYELSSEEEELSDTENAGKYVRAPKSLDEDESNKLDVKDKSDKQISKNIRKKLRNLDVDYARGEGALLSESSSDDDDDEEDESEAEGDNEKVVHAWGELDKDAERTEEVTTRLAACNMDWDRIRATDLMVLLNSFLPPGGLINSVTIYPSEFGLQRMKEEEINGPTELVKTKQENEDNNEEGSKFHMEKLREYQLNRLKYYYAVIECDNKNTANKIYTECDGLEYESSATKVDLRFIPDDMVFDHEPKEVCNKLPEQGKYQPRFFTTTALQQAKVDLTWDETNPERIELAQKLSSGKVDEIAAEDLQAYLASSSGSEDEEEEQEEKLDDAETESQANPIDKYRALLEDIETKERDKRQKDIGMEITWGIDLKEKTEKLVKKKLNEKEERTPFQQYLEKRKEKKKAKREERKKQKESDSDDIPSDVDMNDPYFAEEFNKSEFKKPKSKKKVGSGLEEENVAGVAEAELELLLANSEDQKKHFSLQKIQENEKGTKTKRKQKGKSNAEEKYEDDFKINVSDERFSALYSSHHYNLDPTNPHYKKTRAMEAIANEKLKRRNDDGSNRSSNKSATTNEVTNETSSATKDAELNVLVKSIKRKTEAALSKKSKRIK